MKVSDILNCITEVAPIDWQESYDNAGLQVGDENAEAKKSLVTLDVTEELVDEAIAKGCDLIVSHNPLIFRGLKQITPYSAIGRAVMKAIKHDIAIISMHTNLDNSYLGVNAALAEILGLANLRILQPTTPDPQLRGAGMIGEFTEAMSEKDFLRRVAETIGSPCLRHSAFIGRDVKRVAMCGGSGSFLLSEACAQHADAFLTADVKYHDFFLPEGQLLFVDGGHFETEQFTKELICGLIRKKFPTFAAEIAETNTNSVHYFVKI